MILRALVFHDFTSICFLSHFFLSIIYLSMEFLWRFRFDPAQEGTATSSSAGGLKMVLCDNKTMLVLTIKVNSILCLDFESFLLIVHIFELVFVSYLSLAVTSVMDIHSYFLELGDHLGLGDGRDSERWTRATRKQKAKGVWMSRRFGDRGSTLCMPLIFASC